MDHFIILCQVSTSENSFVRWIKLGGETRIEVGKKLIFEYWLFSLHHSLYQVHAHS